ncbi:DUF3379 domain-containing protein [Pseudoalteromonas sp. CNC9-20]|uniref:DUF3379 family protein n=1 Tax=Pseudoalteromonas sp. CNC9-20 TaxID=2917750 RepID=UPI001EF5A6D1|nr:DUF3379 family protein [Pseudoalteromonas sp. CNC9-20]MCG7571018.1 DUF3379 domain-containing protein [Pseudoalteromonas sp. CNC9-20]
MDELEFRRRLFAHPNTKDKDVLEFAEQSPERKQLVNELKQLDKELVEAMQVPVPDNLADKIIFNQTMGEQSDQRSGNNPAAKQTKPKTPWYIAIAASVVIAFTGVLYQLMSPTLSIGEHALAHVYHEIDALSVNEEIALDEVNLRLSELGGHLDELPGAITYARYCNFKGQKGLHLVFQSDFGPMTVFIVPSANDYLGDVHFNDQRFAGRVSHFPQGDAILVAMAQAPVDEYQARINQSLRWN